MLFGMSLLFFVRYMMGILEVVLLAVGLAMDATAVSLANGLCETDLKIRKSLLMAFLFGAFQAFMPLVGYFAASFFAGFLSSIIPWLALIILSILGIKMITEGKKHISCDCRERHISLKRMLIQAVATSIDALAVGLLLVETQLSPMLEYVAIIGGITFLLSMIALRLGKRIAPFLENKAEYVGGVILIGIGLKIFIEYLISIF